MNFSADKWYVIYGLLIVTALAVAEYRGMGYLDSDEIHNVSKSVRDNPGAYRSHYGGK